VAWCSPPSDGVANGYPLSAIRHPLSEGALHETPAADEATIAMATRSRATTTMATTAPGPSPVFRKDSVSPTDTGRDGLERVLFSSR